MSDIVERLRAPAYWMSGSGEEHEGENDAPYKAADEIERLRAENVEFDVAAATRLIENFKLSEEVERLRAALTKIANGATGYLDCDSDLARIARKALEGKHE